ncbi:DNA-binding transcriptional regulator, LysR family [Novosphingobium mathurense]|uniref:DNA-binding transcriptional regulator, LysR family n=2 Tax=Novosphingobium mathurense TaxID=428990 RepID=A0A1U6IM71_9SPHN|nr:DNA-binding transcriptional regulator, LysR family [Novosphingobium mathurense]
MRWRIDDLFALCAVVETGGVTAAALKLDCPKSTVSKALSRLEADLGLRLIERTSRRLRVTPEGEAFFARASAILELAEEADAMMLGMRSAPAGRVSLALPTAFSREIFAPRLAEFAEAYPEIELDLIVSPGASGVREDCDLAVVVGPQPDSALMQKVLLGGRLLWVASPEYALRHRLDSTPPDDFSEVRIYETRFVGSSLALDVSGKPRHLHLSARGMSVNDPLTVREAVRGGLGVSFLPERYCETALAAGDLVEVWQEVRFSEGAARVAVVFPGTRLLSPRFRAVITFLEEICRRPGATP